MLVDAVVLAGQANQGALRDVSSATNEALIEVAGRPMLQYVIDALAGCERVRKIVVVRSERELQKAIHGEIEFVPGRGSMIDNLLAGAEALPGQGFLLVATSDIPLVTSAILDDFLAQCEKQAGDVFYPVIEKSIMEAKYPQAVRTYVKTRDGTFTGGNLMVLDRAVLQRCARMTESFVAARKKPWQLARLLGISFVFGLLLGRLSLKRIEGRVSELFAVRGWAVRTPHPEIGLDVDKPSDLDLINRIMEQNAQVRPGEGG